MSASPMHDRQYYIHQSAMQKWILVSQQHHMNALQTDQIHNQNRLAWEEVYSADGKYS